MNSSLFTSLFGPGACGEFACFLVDCDRESILVRFCVFHHNSVAFQEMHGTASVPVPRNVHLKALIQWYLGTRLEARTAKITITFTDIPYMQIDD